MKQGFLGLTLAVLWSATMVGAADYADPTWPCIQRKVENLSAGLMWSLPQRETAVSVDAAVAQEITTLADTLSLRRIPVEELQLLIDEFATRHDGDPALLGQVFTAVFEPLNNRRGRIISGIGDFSLGQIALAQKIDAARVEMTAQMAKAEPDFDKVDAIEEQLDWDQVIFTDRQRSIEYLCETPVIIERRLFEIARMLQQAAKT
jgi:hypothetical protein